ncbi:MAG: choice-of-anchor tandem repeat GloVer-containing protein [Candidatus Sulfotelmatobacter sp.]
MKRVDASKIAGITLAFLVATTIASSAQTLTTLVSFDETNGGVLSWDLVQGVDGNFYGSGGFGGANNLGTVFQITPEGTLATLDRLEYSHLSVQAMDGNLYGTTPYSGTGTGGTVFKLTPGGTLTTLYNFCSQPACADGQSPFGGVIQGNDGNFYGATADGGAYGYGTVFKITPAGELTTLYSFPSYAFANTALVEGNDGNFYGTTESGGANGYGTIFRVTTTGRLTILHSFSGPDGKSPHTALTLGSDGNFYGTTSTGGANDPTLCEGVGCGTIFKITLRGLLTTLYSFCAKSGCTDGQWPTGDLVEGSDGNFYGTNQAGGAFGYTCVLGSCGTVFKITPQGTLTTLHSFSGSDGSMPYAGLVQGTDGVFYGSTIMGSDLSCGGGYGCGTVFNLSVGLGPFVETRPTNGSAGTAVTILGNHLLGSTSVIFNHTVATFEVVSDTEITATVPTGATTGPVAVTTADGTLKSKVPFRVGWWLNHPF